MIWTGLIAYCFFLYIRPGDWVPAVLGWPMEFATLGLITTVASFQAYTMQDSDEGPKMGIPCLFLGGWLMAIALSNATSGRFDLAFEFLVFYAKKAVIAFALWMAITTEGRLRAVMIAMVLLSGALGWQGLYQKTHGVGWAGQPMYWDNRICWIGLWDGANVLSLLFVTAVPFALEFIVGSWNWLLRLIALAAAGLMMTGLVLAASRGAWLSLAVVLVLFFKRRVGKIGIILGGLAFAALLVVGPSRLSRSDERDSSSTQGRVSMWAEGLEMFKFNPVFGIGKEQFGAYTSKLIAHNAFVQNMGETGLLGLFFWGGLIYLSYRSMALVTAASAELSPRISGLNEALFTSMTGYLTASMFISTDFDLLYLMFGLCIGVVTVARRESGLPLYLTFDSTDAWKVLGLACAGVFCMYLITMYLSFAK